MEPIRCYTQPGKWTKIYPLIVGDSYEIQEYNPFLTQAELNLQSQAVVS